MLCHVYHKVIYFQCQTHMCQIHMMAYQFQTHTMTSVKSKEVCEVLRNVDSEFPPVDVHTQSSKIDQKAQVCISRQSNQHEQSKGSGLFHDMKYSSTRRLVARCKGM
jgi:hypothetical protein